MATVLIVEDDVFVNMEAIFIVKELGHVTLCAYDVDQALAILQAEGHIDLLFTDIRLKNQHVGGFEVAKQAVYRNSPGRGCALNRGAVVRSV